MNFARPFPPHAFAFKSKGGGSAPAPTPAPAAPPPVVYNVPAAQTKAPSAVPPVSERTIEVEMASRESKLAAKKRKGFRSTLLAGETGGYVAPAADEAQKKTLLG